MNKCSNDNKKTEPDAVARTFNPSTRRRRQVGLSDFETSLVYTEYQAPPQSRRQRSQLTMTLETDAAE